MLSATITGPNQVTLTWSKAKNPVTYYLVAYGTKSGKIEFGNPNVGGADTTSYVVNGLSGGTNYYFKVRAGNNCMPGEFSSEITAKAYGSEVQTPAKGFSEGVLSTNKTITSKVTDNTPLPIKPSKNIFNIIKDFLFRIFRLTNKSN